MTKIFEDILRYSGLHRRIREEKRQGGRDTENKER